MISIFKKNRQDLMINGKMLTYFKIDCIASSEDYRKKVAANLIYAVSYYKNVVIYCKKNAKEIIEKINSKHPQ